MPVIISFRYHFRRVCITILTFMRTGIVDANIFTGYASAKQSLSLARRITLSSKKFQLNILGMIADKIQLFLVTNTTVFVSKYNCICIQILKFYDNSNLFTILIEQERTCGCRKYTIIQWCFQTREEHH